MRLKSITLRNYRGVLESTVHFSDGVTVVEGPNEVGKSSIPEALRLLRAMKASSRAAQVRSVKPVHLDVGPEAQIDLVTGPYELMFRKRWIKEPVTELRIRAPHPEHHTGDEAHDRYNAILAETVDSDLLTAMEMIQGESMKQPELAQVTSLHRALDQSAEQPADHDELIQRIEAEFRKYFTAGGRPTGEYRDVADQVELLREKVAGLRADSREIDQLTDEHRICRERLDGVGTQLQHAVADLERHEEADRVLAGLREAVERSEQQLDDARRDLAEAHTALLERGRLVGELEERAAGIGSGEEAVSSLAAEHAVAQQQLQQAQQAQAQADAARVEARRAADVAQQALRHHQDHLELARIGHQIERAVEATAERAAAQAVLLDNAVDEVTLARLSALDVDVRVARSAREAAATAVSVHALGAIPVTVGQHTLTEGQTHDAPVLDALTIEVDGLARVELRPGTPPAELESSLRDAESALERALKEAGVATVHQAGEVAGARAEALQRIEKAEDALGHVLGSADLEQLRAEHDRLTTRLDGIPPDPSAHRDRLEADHHRARAAEDHAEAAHEDADARLVGARAAADAARDGWVRASETLKLAQQEHQAAHERLEQARALVPDDELARKMERRREAADGLATEVEEHRGRLAESHPEDVEISLNNARDLVSGKRREREELTTQVQGLEVLLADRARSGTYDKLNHAEAELAAARDRQERLHRAAQASRLLHETMVRRRAEVQQKYVAPFKSEIERLGRLVFGQSFRMEISPDLSIASRTLDDVTVPFESLSSGTKEQLSLLGRLASARLVDGSDGAPVIIDDALGFADPERLRALGAVFNHVGSTAQVILLTCQPERYASLGGARVVRLSRTQLAAS